MELRIGVTCFLVHCDYLVADEVLGNKNMFTMPIVQLIKDRFLS